ncbi:MAG: hypothetical protein ACI8V2_004625, partial [Candidatus Latescibacterota bacterium]
SNPVDTIQTAKQSIIREINSSVLIKADTHEELWNVPLCVSTPGDPITGYLRINVADRHGKDKSFGKNYFTSTDLFQTITPTNKPNDAFKHIFMPIQSNLPNFPQAIGHMQYSPAVFLDSNTVIKSFTFKTDDVKNWVTTAKCKIENNMLHAIELGNAHTIENSRRGLYEPHLVRWKNRFYMTGRAEDKRGHLLISDDGLTWSKPQPWTWDNGEEIAMDQTMTKLLSHPDGLVLAYTRIRDDNTNTFRHRAPLHVAGLDPTTHRLIRNTERIIVPDKGMAVGNFWAWPITQDETLIFTAEWPRDGRPSNGDIWISRIKWRNPNTDITPEGAIQSAQ